MSAPTRSGGVGLVHSSTSDTRCLTNPVELDPWRARMRRKKHATITAARLISEQLSSGGRRTYPVMITLTYARPGSWHSRHVSAFLKVCREWFSRRGRKFYYCWTAELQKRGALHYHIVVWMPKGYRLPKPDRRGWWPHGLSKIEACRNAVGYIAKYAAKEDDRDTFPKGARICGNGGLNSSKRVVLRWWLLPKWVRDWSGEITDVRRVTGGGFLIVSTGEYRPSPFIVFLSGGVLCLVPRVSESKLS